MKKRPPVDLHHRAFIALGAAPRSAAADGAPGRRCWRTRQALATAEPVSAHRPGACAVREHHQRCQPRRRCSATAGQRTANTTAAFDVSFFGPRRDGSHARHARDARVPPGSTRTTRSAGTASPRTVALGTGESPLEGLSLGRSPIRARPVAACCAGRRSMFDAGERCAIDAIGMRAGTIVAGVRAGRGGMPRSRRHPLSPLAVQVARCPGTIGRVQRRARSWPMPFCSARRGVTASACDGTPSRRRRWACRSPKARGVGRHAWDRGWQPRAGCSRPLAECRHAAAATARP